MQLWDAPKPPEGAGMDPWHSTRSSTWNSSIDFPLLDSSMKRKAPIPVLGLSASSRLPCRRHSRQELQFPTQRCSGHHLCATAVRIPSGISFNPHYKTNPQTCRKESQLEKQHSLPII